MKQAEDEGVRIHWEHDYCNYPIRTGFHNAYLRAEINRWVWEDGRIYVVDDEGIRQEIMYFHFLNWKRSLRASEVSLSSPPSAFYISYSHIGLTLEARGHWDSKIRWWDGTGSVSSKKELVQIFWTGQNPFGARYIHTKFLRRKYPRLNN